jgi:phosphoserine phosphatase
MWRTIAWVALSLTACTYGKERKPDPSAASVEAPAPRAGAPVADPLPSWNDGDAKRAVIAFVGRVTRPGGPDFVAEPARIAVFDNDGTLWPEMPAPFELLFALDQVAVMAKDHPAWRTEEPFASVLAGDMEQVVASGSRGLAKILVATHSGMTTDEFERSARRWLASARHPRFDRRYTELAYQPMLELLDYLRASGFTTYLVSGGDAGFMRAFASEVYGIPPEQIIGSSFRTSFEQRGAEHVLVREPKLELVNDGADKPAAIERQIGRRPILAFGNSDGDLEMLQWTAAGDGPYLCGFVHHTDRDREWAYDRASELSKLDRGLDTATSLGWTVVDMKADWRTVFPFQSPR